MILKKEKKRKHTTITIPKKLYGKIEKIIENTGFASVSSFVTFVMREIVASQALEKGGSFTKKDEDSVRRRLKALGYID